jgi:hypothetical protein
MSSLSLDLRAPQKGSLIPEAFQKDLIDNMTRRLKAENPPSCLLRAPTGSGKTFVILKTMANISHERKVIWFWFVPFTTLVNQTLDAVVTNATDLTPILFSQGINQAPSGGQVLISTTQGVSRAAWRRANYNAGGGELERTPAEFVKLCTTQGFEIGVIVDEAHIALDAATEFGHFVSWLDPKYLALATATPKSQRIKEFLTSAGMSDFEAFSVSRDDVVSARLNKAYLQAAVYHLRESTATVADLKRTVLQQAWRRSQAIKADLRAAGIDLTPLLLVQVANGKDTVEEAESDLVRLCGVSPLVIGKHSSDDPNPEMMGAIANDTSKEVLIFKQSAGTGFDAPRAFVLASYKSVSDADFALQFIGRVMRVSREIRAAYAGDESIPPDFNTAYVYLANADTQRGFQEAVQTTAAVKSSLEGEIEKMMVRKTRGGADVITNRITLQPELGYRMPGSKASDTEEALPGTGVEAGVAGGSNGAGQTAPESTVTPTASTGQGAFDLGDIDTIVPDEIEDSRPNPREAASVDEWERLLAARGVGVYPIRRYLPKLPPALKREDRPKAVDMEAISKRVATQVEVSDHRRTEAFLAARNRLREKEQRTELTTKQIVSRDDVVIVVDRNIVAAEATAVLSGIRGLEPDDQKIIVGTLADRVRPALKSYLADFDALPSDIELQRMSRTAAQWLVRVLGREIEEAFHAELASCSLIADGADLPAAMLFPVDIALPVSAKNIYGVLPPSLDDLSLVDQTLVLDDRALIQDQCWRIGDAEVVTGKFDGSFAMNKDELAFAQALDGADYVSWWFRNPDKKAYSVRLTRGDHSHYFYPDFLVCLEHVDGQEPKQRLVETKHDLKDARRKSRHTPAFYGKVLFLTQDGGRLYVVTDEGGIGSEVDLGDMEALRSELQKTVP